MAKKKKKPNSTQVQFNKQSRIDNTIRKQLHQLPIWRVGYIDVGGPWSWENINKRDLLNLLEKLKNFETMKTIDFINPKKGSHEIKIEKISNEAKKRLKELANDDIDNLVSLRITSKKKGMGNKKSQHN